MNNYYNMFLNKDAHENLCYRLIKRYNKKHKIKLSLRLLYNTYTMILSFMLLITLIALLLNLYYRIVVPILVWHHNQIEYKIFIEQTIEHKEKIKEFEKENKIKELEQELENKEKQLQQKIENINKILKE